jgi:hypothetical protein
MKKKTIAIILLILLIVIVAALLIVGNLKKEENEKNNTEITETTNLDKLEEIINNSGYFEDSSFTKDETNDKLTIDNKYDVYIKSGYYMMYVKDTKDEDTYCKIVDAVEMNLGLEKGQSIETCTKTLDGTINLWRINVEVNDSYKLLTVDNTEKTSLYDASNAHSEGELISLDEINYIINVGNYEFSSMSNGISDEIKMLSICGYIYNAKGKSKDFTITTYDVNKEKLDEEVITYDASDNKLTSFCSNFENNAEIVKYYSVTTSN